MKRAPRAKTTQRQQTAYTITARNGPPRGTGGRREQTTRGRCTPALPNPPPQPGPLSRARGEMPQGGKRGRGREMGVATIDSYIAAREVRILKVFLT